MALPSQGKSLGVFQQEAPAEVRSSNTDQSAQDRPAHTTGQGVEVAADDPEAKARAVGFLERMGIKRRDGSPQD
jgi:hypothetical protein